MNRDIIFAKCYNSYFPESVMKYWTASQVGEMILKMGGLPMYGDNHLMHVHISRRPKKIIVNLIIEVNDTTTTA